MAKQDDKTLEEILDDWEFRANVFKYAKIGAFLGVTGLFIYFKGYTRGVPYGYTLALRDIKTTFPEIYNGLMEALKIAK